MPTTMLGNPAAFLGGAGGVAPPMGGMFTGGGRNPMLAGGGGGGGGDDDSGGMPGGGDPSNGMGAMAGQGFPPQLQQLQQMQALLPQLQQQQQLDFKKQFLLKLVQTLSAFMRDPQLGPKTIGHLSGMVIKGTAATDSIDKEAPGQAPPVQSLLAQGIYQRPQMGAPLPTNGLQVMR